jgi:hypothetical protein
MSINALFAIAVLILVLAAAANAQSPINLSGYEIFRGIPCGHKGVTGKCGVKFAGWIGGGGPGPESTGWVPFPGTGQGVWSADISYVGSAGFGHLVSLSDGSMVITFADGTSVSGIVTTGSFVEWPPNSSTDSFGCGAGVAQVLVNLDTDDGAATFDGCLHDLPPGTAVPPKTWGSFLSAS